MGYFIFAIAGFALSTYAQKTAESCEAAYGECLAAGNAEVTCQCDLATCVGEDNARTREYCATATAGLSSSTPTATIITGTPGSQPSGQPPITAAAGSLNLGDICSDSRQCKQGECWGSNAGIIRRCGNFNAACTIDADCAYNSCNNGLCNGFLPSSASSTKTVTATSTATASIITGTPGSQPSGQPPITAAAGSLNLGDTCSDSRQCKQGECWGSNAGIIRRCGNFNAVCSTNADCAYNSCNNGLCNGFLPSSAYPANSATATSTAAIATGGGVRSNSTATATATGAVHGGNSTSANPTGGMAPTSSLTPYTGGASMVGALSGVAAVVAGVVALVV